MGPCLRLCHKNLRHFWNAHDTKVIGKSMEIKWNGILPSHTHTHTHTHTHIPHARPVAAA